MSDILNFEILDAETLECETLNSETLKSEPLNCEFWRWGRRRWRLVDFGARSEAFLYGEHLRDWHHPEPAFMLDIMDTYLNMHRQHQVHPSNPKP